MEGVLLGFGVVLVLVAVGFAAAMLLPLEKAAMQKGLTPAIYYITNPALMFVLLAETDLRAVVGVYTPIALLTAAAGGAVYALASRLVLRRSAAQTAVGAMASSYVNAGNIGIPIALYAVGSSAPVVSVLIAQLLLVAPAYLVVFALCARRLDRARGGAAVDGGIPGGAAGAGAPGGTAPGGRRPLGRTLATSVANPVTLGTAAGAVASLAGLRLPEVIWTPVEMLGHASVPLLLMLFGMSLHGQRPLGQPGVRADVALASVVKLALMPAAAWAIAQFGFGLGGTELLGVVVMAALPTAQNVFLFSSQFGLQSALVRDVILLSSLLSLPAVLLAALLLG